MRTPRQDPDYLLAPEDGARLAGRVLFYVLVIPTSMPGAFFWRNRAFEEHARKTELANMPQVGVLPDAH